MTPHINAKPGDFSDIVLMPGDPLRAKFIAENYLDNFRLITDVRNVLGYTGIYKGRTISIMAHGMGIPSCSIYATELFKFYDVKKIIRLGSASSFSKDIKINDIIIGLAAFSDSNVNKIRFNNLDIALTANYDMIKSVEQSSINNNINIHIGNIFSTDLYYYPEHYKNIFNNISKYGVIGAEMEAAGLYGAAIEYGAKALTMCTISEHYITGESTSSDEREHSFHNMIVLALETTLTI